MKNIKIKIPKGYEIDKDKSTFENIVFKAINVLPNSWKELEVIDGYWVSAFSMVRSYINEASLTSKNTFKTKEQAEASIALAQLSQLRDVYRQGWEPDWNDCRTKFSIEFYENKLGITPYYGSNVFLSFQDEETTVLFLENFRDLIEKAKPLMS